MIATSIPGQMMVLHLAGVLSLEDALRLAVHAAKTWVLNKEITEKAIIIHDLEEEKIELMCSQARKMECEDSACTIWNYFCTISNYVCTAIFNVSGHPKAVDLVADMARKAGGSIRHGMASHVALSAELVADLDKTLPKMRPPLYSVWMPNTGEPVRPGCDPADTAADLKDAIANPMLILQCVNAMRKEGIKELWHFPWVGKPVNLGSAADVWRVGSCADR